MFRSKFRVYGLGLGFRFTALNPCGTINTQNYGPFVTKFLILEGYHKGTAILTTLQRNKQSRNQGEKKKTEFLRSTTTFRVDSGGVQHEKYFPGGSFHR